MPTELAPLWLSLQVASAATLLIVLCGLPTALLMARVEFPGKGLVSGLLVLPLVLPPTVLGYYMLQVLGREGHVGIALERYLGWTVVFQPVGAVLASTVAAFPLFFLPARGAIEGVDPALESAARLLGRTESSVLWSITLPLAWRGIIAGLVLAFARALGDFGATLMVAGDIPDRTRTAPIAIYNAVSVGDSATAGKLTLALSALAMLALWVSNRVQPATIRRASR